MNLQSLLVQFLNDLTGPWLTSIATVLLFFTGGMILPGYTDYPGAWMVHTVAAFCLLVIGANFLFALGLLP